jgi:hypothetical protein
MLPAKEFLLQECRNVGELLRDALRYEYGPAGSRDFFDECSTRLSSIRDLSKGVDPDNHQQIRNYASELSHLSRLIAQIERSHIGEFPWAFGERLKTLAETLLAETELDRAKQIRKAGHPLFFIMAEGGLTAFEARRDATGVKYRKRQICTIVVSRSLKHHVLLHAILGHEVGHSATWSQTVFKDIDAACAPLGDIDTLSTSEKLIKWAEKASPEVVPKLKLRVEEARRLWLRELLCDLFGLLTLGPAYFAAVRTMLDLTDPTGTHIVNSHPPHVWRFQLLEYAYRELGWHKPLPTSVNKDVRDAHRRFHKELFKYDHKEMKAHKVITKKEVAAATRGLRDWLIGRGNQFFYQPMDPKVLQLLLEDLENLRPPIGQRVGQKSVVHQLPEFRHILHAGWMACHMDIDAEWSEEEKENTFTIINRLCDQAIIQNLALATGFAKEAEAPPVEGITPPPADGGPKPGKKAKRKAKKRAKKPAKKDRNRARA